MLSPGEDLFTKVIGPDHPGHTRAVGHDVGSRKGMQGTDKKKMKKHENETIEKLQVAIDLMGYQLAKLQAHFDL